MEKIENKISFDIRGCAFKIHNALGPGLLESVYEAALSYELIQLGYKSKIKLVFQCYMKTYEWMLDSDWIFW